MVRAETFGQSYARAICLVKFEKHSVVWRLTYYRPRGEWKLQTIFFEIHPQAVERLFTAEK